MKAMKKCNKYFCNLKALGVIIAVLMLGLLFAVSPLAGRTLAKADGGEAQPPSTDPEGDLYWISDNDASAALSSQIAARYQALTVHFTYIPSEMFDEQLPPKLLSGEINVTRNSHVIFEMTQTRRSILLGDSSGFLSDIFEMWDGMGCKIMFLCGTDENLFFQHNDFLQFVDIHINIDMLTQFLINIFYRLQEHFNVPQVENVSFFIDKGFSDQIVEKGYCGSEFFYHYLIPFIRFAHMNDLPSGITNKDLMLNHNIKIVCDLGENGYFDAVNGVSINVTDIDDLYLDYLRNEKVYEIGNTECGRDYSYSWYQKANEIKSDAAEGEVEIYVYNSAGYDFYYEFGEALTAGAGTGLIPTIIDDFLRDYDLTVYDNWEGKCEITYKDVTVGSGGWMFGLGAEGDGPAVLLKPEFLEFLAVWQVSPSRDVIIEELEMSYYEIAYGYKETWGESAQNRQAITESFNEES